MYFIARPRVVHNSSGWFSSLQRSIRSYNASGVLSQLFSELARSEFPAYILPQLSW